VLPPEGWHKPVVLLRQGEHGVLATLRGIAPSAPVACCQQRVPLDEEPLGESNKGGGETGVWCENADGPVRLKQHWRPMVTGRWH